MPHLSLHGLKAELATIGPEKKTPARPAEGDPAIGRPPTGSWAAAVRVKRSDAVAVVELVLFLLAMVLIQPNPILEVDIGRKL